VTLRLADIGARIVGIQQLGAVVNAMRGIAAARAQQARGQLAAVDNYERVIADGIGRALALMPPHSETAPTRVRPALDLVGSALFLVGTRGGVVLAEHEVTPDWSGALPAHSGGIPKLANQMVEALYARIANGDIERLDVIFSTSQPQHPPEIYRATLLPLDVTKFATPRPRTWPLLNLAPPQLLAALTADYLFAKLCHAALHAFAAENEARMEAMAAARDQSVRRLATLRDKERQVRQEEITAEVIELAAGAAATRA
jgi:F-type H+-transporting ATPase subunit gamma